MKTLSILFLFLSLSLSTLSFCQTATATCQPKNKFDGKKLLLTQEEWKQRLTPDQFKILRDGKTEKAFQNAYFDNEKPGTYECAGCFLTLFSSQAKYDSKTGWPSFHKPICEQNVTFLEMRHFFTKWTEVLCSRCDGHLGHLFHDGPSDADRRYCINSAALTFVPQ